MSSGPFANANDHEKLLAIVHQSMRASSTQAGSITSATKPATPRTPTRKSVSDRANIENAHGRVGIGVNDSRESRTLDALSMRSSPKAVGANTQRGSVVSRYVSASKSNPVSKANTNSPGSKDGKINDPETKEAVRAMVRKYLTLDELSDEATQLARRVRCPRSSLFYGALIF